MARPGGGLSPVAETREDSDVAIAKVGERAVAFPLGPPEHRAIAIAALPDGRVVRRLPLPGGLIESLAASSDGSRLFYVSGHQVWSVPAEGGEAKKIGEGDSVASGEGELIVKLNGQDGFHLARLPWDGGPATRIPVPAGAALTDPSLSPSAVAPDGRILVQVNEPHVWFYRMAAVDPHTGRLDLIPVDYDGDVWYPGWTPDGKIIGVGMQYSAGLWRVRRHRP
jgi:hypothetical protein